MVSTVVKHKRLVPDTNFNQAFKSLQVCLLMTQAQMPTTACSMHSFTFIWLLARINTFYSTWVKNSHSAMINLMAHSESF